ncbi:hypothetical protein AAFF_G00111490 [Aldrovandia affinis]|uniref:Hepatocyte growth factor n=1 Tax=Aldrovandia affinis TaxID=143900 RepID=A0AAD7RTQ7_9TELE|nr:hypothetical protein AAFF_G00111490 [Aldrovandia affinis]
MWIYKALVCVTLAVCSAGKRNFLQDYQKSDGLSLVRPNSSYLTKTRSISVARCARRCSRSKRMPFTCRAFYFDQKNRKCHWLSFDSYTPGVHSEHDFNFDLYEKKDYVKQCIISTGLNYKGTRSVTKSGVRCQAWASTMPHEHKYLHARDKQTELVENYCRNPDNETTGPWCFTTDPDLRFETCGIPQCSEAVCMKCNGEQYRGPMDHTESGKECQRWDLVEPHRHLFHPKRYPDKGLKDNFCRNPDNRLRPWCFTLDPRVQWEYCDIQVCDSDPHIDVHSTTNCFRGQGEGYHGTVGVTPSGVTCQRWDSQSPHNHSYSPQNYKCKDLRENYCRNPDGGDLPWCFTTDPSVRMAFCTNIPRCEAQPRQAEDCYEGNGEKYKGRVSKTRSGIRCGPWEDHKVTYDRRKFLPGVSTEKIKASQLLNLAGVQRLGLLRVGCQLSSNTAPPRSDASKASCFFHKTTRIVGGAQTRVREGSWVVSIQKGNMHWCGGTLMREKWVLTTRQCFSSCVPDLSEYRVWTGFLHLNDSGGPASSKQELRIAHIICGPDGSNLALLKLSQPAMLGERVGTIQLPVSGCAMKEGVGCNMYGWGETKGTGHEGVMKAVQLPIVSNEKCNEFHRRNIQITESRICAGGRKSEGVCDKDYGGPLVCQEGESKVILGVSVHGRGCALANRPAIFINVPFYADWIHKVFKYYSHLEENQ